MRGCLPHAAIVRCFIAGRPRRPKRGDQTGRQSDLHTAAIPFDPRTMQSGIGVVETYRCTIGLELFGVKPLEQHLLDPPRVDVEPMFRCEIRVREHGPVEGHDRGHAVDAQFGERPPRPLQTFLARGGVHDEFGEHGIEMIGDNRTGLHAGVEAYARPAGRPQRSDTPGEWRESERRVFRVEAEFHRVPVVRRFERSD